VETTATNIELSNNVHF